MKIGSIYRELIIESFEGMISEEELAMLDEVAWVRKLKDKLKAGDIPLTPSVVKHMIGEPRVVEAFHITDFRNVFDIKHIIGKRNSISAFKHFSEYKIKNATGIQTDGGIVLKISGILDIMSEKDIMSTLDTSISRRWISSNILSQSVYYKLIDYFRDFNFDDSISSVRTYMNKIYSLLDTYRDEVKKGLINLVFGQGFNYGWNELLVRNVKVTKIAWLPKVVLGKGYDESNADENIIVKHIEDKLKALTPDVSTFWSGDEIVKWFKDNGGHVDIGDFYREEIKNYKDEDLLHTPKGISLLYYNKRDFIKDNIDKLKEIISNFGELEIAALIDNFVAEDLDFVCELVVSSLKNTISEPIVRLLFDKMDSMAEVIDLLLKNNVSKDRINKIIQDYRLDIDYLTESFNGGMKIGGIYKELIKESLGGMISEVSDEVYELVKTKYANARVIMSSDDEINYRPTPINKQEVRAKPWGLWYGIGDEWISWVKREMPDWETENVFILDLNESNILFIRNYDELVAFEKEFEFNMYDLARHKQIDWRRVAEKYDGIEIAPYIYKARYDHMWYYGWDIASGCLWGDNVIKSIQKIS